MTMTNKLNLLEEWDFPQGRLVFTKELSNDRLLFKDPQTDFDLIVPMAELERLHAEGAACRYRSHLAARRRATRYDDLDDVPPDGAKDDDLARRFYCKKWDKDQCSKSDKALDRLIAFHEPEAKRRGLIWVPSAGALRRAINTRGEIGHRPLRVMQSQRGQGTRVRWPKTTVEILKRSVFWYYSARTRDRTDAFARMKKFIGRVNRLGRLRVGETWQELKTPDYETLRTKINANARLETWTEKYGPMEARRRFKGTQNSIQADGILDHVMIDSTVVDGWCVLDDTIGFMIPAGRPTLTVAIDVFSRTILAVVLTYAPPSLYTIMSCLQLITTKKLKLAQQYPEFRTLWEDKWGKPDNIIVDNAWEQVGVSFQDACEDAGINVTWAPVANPEYKPIVEKFFDTLNKKLFHKLTGGVPFPPNLMRKLGLDPAKDATIERSRLEGLIYQTLRDAYQYETHSGIGMSPETAWRAGLSRGREIIDDVNFLGAAFGAVQTGTLTRSGIRFKQMRFHAPEVTTKLLNDLAHTTPSRQRRIGSATAKVKFKYNPSDVSQIQVWNPKKKPRKGYDVLPNVDSRYTAGGLGIGHHDRVKIWADNENLAFQTDDERWAARDSLRVAMERQAPLMKFAAMKKQRLLLDSPKPVLQGDIVDFQTGTPGILSIKETDIPVEIAAEQTVGNGIPEKGARRGGSKASKKAAKTRAAKLAGGAEAAASRPALDEQNAPYRAPIPSLIVDNTAAYMADLALRIANAGKNEDI